MEMSVEVRCKGQATSMQATYQVVVVVVVMLVRRKSAGDKRWMFIYPFHTTHWCSTPCCKAWLVCIYLVFDRGLDT